MILAVRDLIVSKLHAGADLIPAIIEAALKLWPSCTEPGSCGAEKTPHCYTCASYNATGPEVKILDEFRAAVGTRVLGSWRPGEEVEGSWTTSHTRDDAVSILQTLAS